MSIELSPRQQSIIEHLVASGSFADATAAIDRAIQLLELHEKRTRNCSMPGDELPRAA